MQLLLNSKIIFFPIFLLSQIGCQKYQYSSTNLGLPPVNSAIIQGTLVKPTDSISKSTVGIYNERTDYLCSGVYIGNSLVLTAAHCVDESKINDLIVIFNNDMIKIIDSNDENLRKTFVRKISGFRINPLWFETKTLNKPFDRGDLAIIKFHGDAPASYQPQEMLSDETILKKDLNIIVAGFGVNKVDTEEVSVKKNSKFKKLIESGEVLCDKSETNCFQIQMSGEGLLRQGRAPLLSIYDTEVRLKETGQSGTCSGDSGGPAFVEQDGKLLLFGITSFGSSFCDDYGVYTNLLKYQEWINTTAKEL